MLFQNLPYNLDEDFSACFFFPLSVANTVCSGAGSGGEISSRFFIWNILFLKSLRFFSLVLKGNLVLFKKYFFPTGSTPLPIPFSSLDNLLCSLSGSSNINFCFF